MADLQDLRSMVGRRVTEVEYESGANKAYLIDDKGYGHEVEVEPVYEDDESEE